MRSGLLHFFPLPFFSHLLWGHNLPRCVCVLPFILSIVVWRSEKQLAGCLEWKFSARNITLRDSNPGLTNYDPSHRSGSAFFCRCQLRERLIPLQPSNVWSVGRALGSTRHSYNDIVPSHNSLRCRSARIQHSFLFGMYLFGAFKRTKRSIYITFFNAMKRRAYRWRVAKRLVAVAILIAAAICAAMGSVDDGANLLAAFSVSPSGTWVASTDPCTGATTSNWAGVTCAAWRADESGAGQRRAHWHCQCDRNARDAANT